MPNLTHKIIEAAKPKAKPYKLSDAFGLYLNVSQTGVKSWRYLYKESGKHKTKTYGKYPDISLAVARQMHQDFKRDLKSGIKGTKTFDEVKAIFIPFYLRTLKNAKHKQQVQYRLDEFVSPLIGMMPMHQINRTDLVRVVKKVQERGITETAHRVATHIRQVFDFAMDEGVISTHPANHLSRVLDSPKAKHMNCILVKDAGQLFNAINKYDEPITRVGLKLAALTFVRTNELRFMRWDEIHDDKFWVIPESRMKMKKPHVVPLSETVQKLLKEIEVYTGEYEFVLTSPLRVRHPVSENTLLFALYRLGYRGLMTVHGFRALASTVLNEQSPFKHDVIERQLAHKESDAVRAAYNRAEYLDERIKLMEWWAEWVNNAEACCDAR